MQFPIIVGGAWGSCNPSFIIGRIQGGLGRLLLVLVTFKYETKSSRGKAIESSFSTPKLVYIIVLLMNLYASRSYEDNEILNLY